MKQYRRSTRLAEQMLRDISQLMEVELAESLAGMVTFTRVRVTEDLRYATVYYSVLGEEQDRRQAADYFEREHRRIRKRVGANLRIRHIPELRFKFDPSIEEGIRIEQLLNEIKDDTES